MESVRTVEISNNRFDWEGLDQVRSAAMEVFEDGGFHWNKEPTRLVMPAVGHEKATEASVGKDGKSEYVQGATELHFWRGIYSVLSDCGHESMIHSINVE